MSESFGEILSVGEKKNSLGRAGEVVDMVLAKKTRLGELYRCMFSEDAWIRMRAADSFEKVGREHPEWLEGYIDRIQSDLSRSPQASIQWHLAQIYRQVKLSSPQRQRAIAWMEGLLSTIDVDWIVAANAMDTLAYFTRTGHFDKTQLLKLVKIQGRHKSNAVVRRSVKIANEFS
jgi:hypothetical protein